MKKHQKLAIAAVGLSSLVWAAKPASAIDFNLSGTLQSGDTFSGTYSIDDDVAATTNVTKFTPFSSYNINFFNPLGDLEGNLTLDSNTVLAGIAGSFAKARVPEPGNSGVLFLSQSNDFQILFSGTVQSLTQPLGGNLAQNSFFFSGYKGTLGGREINTEIASARITSAAKPVPEPTTISGIVVASSIGWLMKKKQTSAEKAKA